MIEKKNNKKQRRRRQNMFWIKTKTKIYEELESESL